MGPTIPGFRISDHAARQMARRQIPLALLNQVLAAPEQRLAARQGRQVLQSRIMTGGRTYLVRVFIDVDRNPATVVTVYRTSNVTKYWRREP